MKSQPTRVTHSTHAILAFIALGCAVPSTNARPSSLERMASANRIQDDEAAEPSIRFGDPAGAYDVPFFPGTTYDEGIPTPDSILGQQHGSRLAHHAEILRCFETWAAASPRVTFHSYGRTHEGRELSYAVVTSPSNHDRLESILSDLGQLHDPRGLSEADADRIVRDSPAVAWMGYSIHGDELSGADASLAVAFYLIAGQGDEIDTLLENVVVVIDPCMNPDGRERIIGMVEQSAGYTPNLDYASMQRGRWPHGRGNHYLFDMNRDWMVGTQPETRGRWRIARKFHPQLFVDAHEMGTLDTFLFYPQNRPVNPNLPTWLIEWQRRYAEDAAAAFDRYGWSYYTREWADAWAPFYSDSWGSLMGATGMLYEQAALAGFPVRRSSGEILTYREAVHHQAVASIANLETLSAARSAALAAYLENGRRNVSSDTPGNDRMFVALPDDNVDRMDELIRILDGQGIEYAVTTETLRATNVESALNGTSETMAFPAGALVVRADQPMSQMVQAYLEFDHRMPLEDLKREREDLEQKGSSRIYDSTSWSVPLALDLDAYWCDRADVATRERDADQAETSIVGSGPAVAWLVSGANDTSVAFAARAMESHLAVHVSDIEVPINLSGERVTLPRGSILVRATENEGDAQAVENRVLKAARQAGERTVYRVSSGLTPDAESIEAPDLGGGHFTLLSRPRVAILTNSPVSADKYGHLWHHLDTEVGIPFSLLDAQSFGGVDLRRYNVLIIPPGGVRSILEANSDSIEAWVEGGGTLIAFATSAAALTSGNVGLSSVTLRRDALEDLSAYEIAAAREATARNIEIDEAALWGDEPDDSGASDDDDDRSDESSEEEDGDDDDEEEDPFARYDAVEIPAAHDEWLRNFSPFGVTLRGIVDENAWITCGADEELPVFFSGSRTFLSDDSVKTAVRLADEPRLRISGLVWPEARERIASSAWLTVERVGNGQIILFASLPAYRGFQKATGRLFANAVVLGPGAGASQPSAW